MKLFFRLGQGLVTILLITLGLVGILILARIVLLFFGQLKTFPGYQIIIGMTNPLIVWLDDVSKIETPYGGGLELSAVIILILIVLFESLLSIFRGIMGRRA